MSVVPKKSLGQHFLVDDNILGVIGRLAQIAPDDVVLEIGPGLGVLTDYLAARVARVHAVELDRSLEAPLRERLGDHANVDVHYGDALALDLAALAVESLDGLPGIDLWCVMVQREVADRFFAEPSTKAYGAVSVLVQLATERIGFHPVARTVFRPRPNVDSALVAFRRRELPDAYREIKGVVEAAFAHRRKTLPNSIALAGLASRERGAEALEAIGRRPETRAEELTPRAFEALMHALR